MTVGDSLVEYQIVVNVYTPAQGGQTLRRVIRVNDRTSAISKHNYLTDLIQKKKLSELKAWTEENLNIQGMIQNIEGLYGTSYIKII